MCDTCFVGVQVRLSSLIGRGSFGSVFSAWKGNQPIAVKVGSMLLASRTPYPPSPPRVPPEYIHRVIQMYKVSRQSRCLFEAVKYITVGVYRWFVQR